MHVELLRERPPMTAAAGDHRTAGRAPAPLVRVRAAAVRRAPLAGEHDQVDLERLLHVRGGHVHAL